MLDSTIRTQLRTYLTRLVEPIELVVHADASARAREMRTLLEEIAGLSDKVTVRDAGETAPDERRPSFSVGRPGEAHRMRFAGIPLGHEFTSLVLALLQAGGHPPRIEAEAAERIRALAGEHRFETYVSLSCQNCPDVVQALNAMAALNPGVTHVMIDGALFQDEVERKGILSVPTTLLNGEPFAQGRMSLAEILAKLDTGSASRAAPKLAAKEPFDVLVVGGGPAGAAAAIYAARKGVRTGVISDRFGGQVLDTLGIENFISVSHTEGPRLARELEQHVREYGVDIMDLQRAEALVPGRDGGLSQVRLASGAVLEARAVIVATGARWREMNVPGEREYRGRGVAYCPHCDGPLFKGKRVAVIGGGNSGVEAAIDLAGTAAQVTLLEFADALRADAVLQRKLRGLANVTVITGAQTTEVTGDGRKVNGLVYKERRNGLTHRVELEGVFVQIGLVPNTGWLDGTVALARGGEIEVDARGQTSVPGVFAAGDATTTPFKQIVIAMGEGAKASLAAFEHLIRTSETRQEEALAA